MPVDSLATLEIELLPLMFHVLIVYDFFIKYYT